MTDDDLDRARAEQARLLAIGRTGVANVASSIVAQTAARLAREGWTPPDPLEAEIDAILENLPFMTNGQMIRKALNRGIEIGKAEAADHG